MLLDKEQIRDLAYKYALAMDTRDLNNLVSLYTEDTRTDNGYTGLTALKRQFQVALPPTIRYTHHQVGNHLIEFVDSNSAKGIVYSNNQVELGQHWLQVQMLYIDEYRKHQGQWFFLSRQPVYRTVSEEGQAPLGEAKLRWPGQPPQPSDWSQHFPAWDKYWSHPEDDSAAAPVDHSKFISNILGEN